MHPASDRPRSLQPCPAVLVPIDWFDWPERTAAPACCTAGASGEVRRLDQARATFFAFLSFSARWFAGCSSGSTSSGSFWATLRRWPRVAIQWLRKALARLARRPGRLFPVDLSSRHGVLPLVGRGTVRVRIERLPGGRHAEQPRSSVDGSIPADCWCRCRRGPRGWRAAVGDRAPTARAADQRVRGAFANGRLITPTARPSPARPLSASTRQNAPAVPRQETATALRTVRFRGELQLPRTMTGPVAVGNRVRLLIRLRDGSSTRPPSF